MKDRSLWTWSALALGAAALFGQQAFAGNYNAVVATNSNIEYFSLELTTGQTLFYNGAPGPVQLLIDDLTYTVDFHSGYGTSQTRNPLWDATVEFTDWMERNPWVNAGGIALGHTYLVGVATTGGGVLVPYEFDRWSSAMGQALRADMQEVDSVGNLIRRFDCTSHVFHATLFGKEGLVDDAVGGQSLAIGVGISESAVGTSYSRHYQTPHIVPIENRVAIAGNLAPAYSPYLYMDVYVKGRIVLDSADALVENSGVIVQ